jgi:hypothetical protein
VPVAHAVILAVQEAEIRRVSILSQPGQIVHETLFQKTLSQKIRLVELLKVKALSSSPSTEKKKRATYHFLISLPLFRPDIV